MSDLSPAPQSRYCSATVPVWGDLIFLACGLELPALSCSEQACDGRP
jgi:hypothetical protein